MDPVERKGIFDFNFFDLYCSLSLSPSWNLTLRLFRLRHQSPRIPCLTVSDTLHAELAEVHDVAWNKNKTSQLEWWKGLRRMDILDEIILFFQQLFELYVQFWDWLIQISGQYGASQWYTTVRSLDQSAKLRTSTVAFFLSNRKTHSLTTSIFMESASEFAGM